VTAPAGNATYVFCVAHATRAPSLLDVSARLPGAGPIRLLAIDRSLWAVVCDAPLATFSPDRIEAHLQDLEAISKYAVAHARVVESFFGRMPVVPLKLFTLFTSDERAHHYMRARSRTLKKLLAQVKGHEEWSVRLTLAAGRERQLVRSSGLEYLKAKKRQRDRSRSRQGNAARRAAAALAPLKKLASGVSPQEFPAPPGSRSVVSGASFLVPVTKRRVWRRAVERLSADLARDGSQLNLTGPWPPYHFVSEPTRTRRARGAQA
jgi:hypothetical protein